MQIKIQPKVKTDGTLPYPFFINKNGAVGRQDFWKGRYHKLIGFSDSSKENKITLSFKDFEKKPKLSIGKYPVFSNIEGDWFTVINTISSYELIN